MHFAGADGGELRVHPAPTWFSLRGVVNFLHTLWSEMLDARTPWLLALFALNVVVVKRERRHRRFGALAFCVGAHLVALAVHAAQHASGDAHTSEFRTVAWVFAGVSFAGGTASFLFHGVLARVGAALPRIVEDVVVGLVAVLAAVTAASRSGANLSGIIATSAVITAVLGFSLQDVIANVAGGLALQLDTSIEVGDWIKVNDIVGRVVEVRWRHTAVETRNWETVLVPNIMLLRNHVTVLGRRLTKPRQWRRWVYFNVDWHHQPSDVIEVAQAAIRGAEITNVATDPAPNCVLMDMADTYGRYAIRYWLTDIAADDPTDSEVRTRLYFALQRADIRLAVPTQSLRIHQEETERPTVKTERQFERRRAMLKAVGFFSTLTEPELDEIAHTLRYAPFARGETITRQGAEAHWLYIVEEGIAAVRITEDSLEREVARLGPASVFGEMSLLTGAPRSASVVAVTDVECFRLEKSAFQRVMARRPELATHFAEMLARRSAELAAAREGLDEEATQRRRRATESDLIDRIQRFFGLS